MNGGSMMAPSIAAFLWRPRPLKRHNMNLNRGGVFKTFMICVSKIKNRCALSTSGQCVCWLNETDSTNSRLQTVSPGDSRRNVYTWASKISTAHINTPENDQPTRFISRKHKKCKLEHTQTRQFITHTHENFEYTKQRTSVSK